MLDGVPNYVNPIGGVEGAAPIVYVAVASRQARAAGNLRTAMLVFIGLF